MNNNRCVACGTVIPEGRKVCPICEKGKDMNAKIKQYVKERDEMLKKCDVAELRAFVNSHKEYYSTEYLRNFNSASDEVLEITLHKMIMQVPKLPKALRDKSALWLITRGFSLNIN